MGGGTDYIRDPLQMGLTIVGVTAALGGVGWWLDSLLGTFPILMVIGAVAGMFGIIYVTVVKLRNAETHSDKSEQNGSGQTP
jgi:F0F1-type ATP synthase assembly protein I